MKKTLALIILDGFGIGEKSKANAITMAKTPIIQNLLETCANTKLGASGLDVGLPLGQMGNSEVGHTNIGAGRIVYQSLTRITKSIKDGDFFLNPTLIKAVDNALLKNSTLHIMGLLSDGGVHSHISHLYALLKLCKLKGLNNVAIHCFTDGRDVSPTSAMAYIKDLSAKIDELGVGKIASICGRYYAMDRDNRWDRVAAAYDAMVNCMGKTASNPVESVEQSYNKEITDEFIIPTVINGGCSIKNDDSVIFFNFRPDRAREITRAIVEDDFDGFTRKNGKLNLTFVTMTEYDANFKNVLVAFEPQSLKNTLGEYLSINGKTQLRIAETEKYAHVTFFFNGGSEISYINEDRELIPSPKVSTYDTMPQMSANLVTEKACKYIENGKYDVVILNFANCDMVGHTGNLNSTIQAVETVDACLGRILSSLKKIGGIAIITADHGNADIMSLSDGSPFTAHTTNPVPLIIVGEKFKLRDGGILADIAPTLLEILDLPKPDEMSGTSLIVK
ncbi:MAG: 2,3-bisphosphoglycerate-independent phosphoglycerate mutase [Oscillospiraceae bacterium]